MDFTVAYQGRSAIVSRPTDLAIALAPNLRRDRVSFAGTLRHPLRFREAISALHDVVISDLRYKPRDQSAYEAYLAEQKEREDTIRRAVSAQKKTELEARRAEPMPPNLEADFRRLRSRYWN